MEEALEELPGVQDVEVDLAADRFDVAHDAQRVSPDELLELVRGLGYEPRLVTSAAGETTPIAQVVIADLPEELKELFSAAREDRAPVLLEFTGPG